MEPWLIVFFKKSLILLPEIPRKLILVSMFYFYLRFCSYLKDFFSYKELNPYMIIISYVMVCHGFFNVMFMM